MKRIIFSQLNLGNRIVALNSSKFFSTSEANESNSDKPDGWHEAKPYSTIPGPKGFPLIGNVWRFLPVVGDLYGLNFIDLIELLYKRFGNIARLGGTLVPDLVILYSPKDIEHLYRNEGQYPIRESTKKTLGYYKKHIRGDIFKGAPGVSEVQGKEWYDVRSKANPIFMRPQTVLQYVEVMDLIAHQLVMRMREDSNLNPQKEMPKDFINHIYAWALETVLSVALDKQLGCLKPNLPDDSEPAKLIRSTLEAFDLFYKLEHDHFIRNMYKSKMWRRYVELMDYMTFIFVKYIEEAAAKSNNNKEEHRKDSTIFQQLLKHGKSMAITIAVDLLVGGADTTGKIMGSGLYYLAKTPEAQNRLREELYKFLPNKDSPITGNILSQTPYLRAVVKEITRLAPISAGNMRQTAKDLILGGYQIPKGTKVISAHLLLSLSEDHYARPKEFVPERWLRTTTGELSLKSVNPFVTLPFGYGPRSCLGKRLVTQELEIGIAKIIRNFYLEWHYKDATFKGTPFYGIVDPLKLRVIEVPC